MRQQLGYLRGLGQDDAPPAVTSDASVDAAPVDDVSAPAPAAASAAPAPAASSGQRMRRHGHGHRHGGGMMMLPMLLAGVAALIAVFALGKASR